MNRSSGILICAVATLLALGVVMGFSIIGPRASTLSVGIGYLLKNTLWVVIGVIGMLFIRRLDYHRLEKYRWYILGAAALLLVAVLVPQIGTKMHGARRWLRFGGFGFQPSELAKLAVMIVVASVCAQQGERMREFWRGLAMPMSIVGLVAGLVLLEPDLGTAALIGFIGLLIVLSAGAPVAPVAGVVAMAGVAGTAIVMRSPWRLDRVLAFLDPWSHTGPAAYQLQHSLISLGSGGLFGRGLGASRQKLWFLPESDTDFIFAIIGEELGLVGTVLVILLFVMIVREGMRISSRAADAFGALLAFGITCMIGLQALTHVAVVTASMPTKGIVLPFVSSGGSSIVITLAGVGILLSIASHAERAIAGTDARADGAAARSGAVQQTSAEAGG